MNKLLKNKKIASLVNFFNKVTLPGFQGMPIGKVMAFFHKSVANGLILHRAAAMTYRIFISLIPLLIALFSALSFFGIGIRNTISNFIESIVPTYVWPAISDMISDVLNKQHGTLFSFSFVFGIYFTAISINSIINILNANYFTRKRKKIASQLKTVALIMAIGLGVILLAASIFIGASAGARYLDSRLFHSNSLLYFTIHLLKWLLLFLLVYVFISLIYYLAPLNRKEYRFFSAGSTFATFAMVLVLGILNFYFANFGNYNALYGSLGAIFAILLWLYWNSIFIIFGYDLNISIVTAKKSAKHKAKQNETLSQTLPKK
ncbi:MAG: YihY/virulence factor BrkB family protein [Bacteroidales bacterium]|nr:YihY/virulence factor BrkB family protein [Bacteroidales bacterium]